MIRFCKPYSFSKPYLLWKNILRFENCILRSLLLTRIEASWTPALTSVYSTKSVPWQAAIHARSLCRILKSFLGTIIKNYSLYPALCVTDEFVAGLIIATPASWSDHLSHQAGKPCRVRLRRKFCADSFLAGWMEAPDPPFLSMKLN